MHELSEEAKAKKPVNPNIPHARGTAEEEENDPANGEQSKQLSLEEIMNPFIDKGGAGFGALIMAATLITILALNAASQNTGEHPVFYVTLPAAFVMFCWDVAFGWLHRHDTRKIASDGRREIERAQTERLAREQEQEQQTDMSAAQPFTKEAGLPSTSADLSNPKTEDAKAPSADVHDARPSTSPKSTLNEKQDPDLHKPTEGLSGVTLSKDSGVKSGPLSEREMDAEKQPPYDVTAQPEHSKATLVSLVADTYRWSQETFPTATAVLGHLPFALVPFAFSMFVL